MLTGAVIGYGVVSSEKYGFNSIGLGLSLVALSVLQLSSEIRSFSMFFNRRLPDENKK
jgi:hypothetical protein